MVLDVGVEQPERGEEPGSGRHQDPRHVQGGRHRRGEEGPVAAEGEHRVPPRVAPALARDRPDGPDHVRGRNLVGAVGGVGEVEAEGARDPFLEDLAAAFGV